MTDEGRERADVPFAVTPEGGPAVPYWQADGKQLLRATWALLRQDKQLIALPFLGSLFGVVAAAIFFFPGFALGWWVDGHDTGRVACYAGGGLAGLGATIVGVFFQTALVIGANERAGGGDPTAASCLRGAWSLRWKILAWAALSATVGFVLQLIQERLGFIGAIANIVGGLAWSIATYVVVPVLVAEDVGPVTAVKRSTQVLRDTWGTSLRTAARGGAIAVVLWLVPLVGVMVGFVMASTGSGTVMVVGIVLVVVSVTCLVAAGSFVSAVTGYAEALVYRYAVGLPTPGMPDRQLAGAFRPK